MRDWDQFIALQAKKNTEETYRRNHSRLEHNKKISKEIGSLIDKILNKITKREEREYGIVEVVRDDKVHREWEATFSVVNMAGNGIVYLASAGYYLQAITLVRQELEGLAQLEHITQGSRINKKAPNIVVLADEIKNLYGELSEGAHLASSEMTALQAPMPTGLDSENAQLPHGPSIIPHYSYEVVDAILEIHIKIRKELNECLHRHIAKLFPDDQTTA